MINSEAFVAWGKLSRDSTGHLTGIHTLLDHMSDVAECFLALVQCHAIRRSLEHAASRALDDTDVQRLAVLVFLHDVGKANAGFQSRYWQLPTRAPGKWPTSPFGHGPEGWELIAGRVRGGEEFARGLPIGEMVLWGDEAVCELLQASISHHGRPLGISPAMQTESIWQPVKDASGDVLYDPAMTLAAMGDRLKSSYSLAFNANTRLLPVQPAFVHLFAGLVQLADWLGSDTRADFFPYSMPGENRPASAVGRARFAVRSIGLDVGTWRERLRAQPPTFSTAFNLSHPRPMQAAAAQASLGSIVILEAETGSGKTEAALWRFVQLFESGKVDSLYFALPTRVAATQLCKRILVFVERLWPHDAPVVVRALPGYEAANDQLKISLADFKVQWPDHPSDAVAHLRWVAESPKRFLAATIAVGTIDQVLLGSLKVRHAHLRSAMLARSMLVVDEVPLRERG